MLFSCLFLIDMESVITFLEILLSVCNLFGVRKEFNKLRNCWYYFTWQC